MRVITGKVIGGCVELPPGEVAEGTLVAVLVDDAESAVLSPEDVRELADRVEAIARGEYVDGDEFLRQLRAQRAT